MVLMLLIFPKKYQSEIKIMDFGLGGLECYLMNPISNPVDMTDLSTVFSNGFEIERKDICIEGVEFWAVYSNSSIFADVLGKRGYHETAYVGKDPLLILGKENTIDGIRDLTEFEIKWIEDHIDTSGRFPVVSKLSRDVNEYYESVRITMAEEGSHFISFPENEPES